MHHGTESSGSRRTPIRWAACTALAVILGLMPVAASAETTGTTKPQLNIAVDNGQESATKGDKLAYTITVANLGTTKVRELVITQSVPVGATFVSADARGEHRADKVTWKLDLKTAKKLVLHASMTVATTPDDLSRLATVACAQVSATGPPLVCATDSDQLPAGAVAESAQHALEQHSAASSHRVWWYSGGMVAVVGIAVASFLLTRSRAAAHRHRRRTQPG
jgi:uncharacterized repeat protein (TIGR01451 family)